LEVRHHNKKKKKKDPQKIQKKIQKRIQKEHVPAHLYIKEGERKVEKRKKEICIFNHPSRKW
jgi:hypothetical protein